jgi:hypothetical protein
VPVGRLMSLPELAVLPTWLTRLSSTAYSAIPACLLPLAVLPVPGLIAFLVKISVLQTWLTRLFSPSESDPYLTDCMI